jgi:hypothetical protein
MLVATQIPHDAVSTPIPFTKRKTSEIEPRPHRIVRGEGIKL